MHSVKPAVLVFVSSLVLSCNHNPVSPRTRNSEILPLAVGNQWVYHVSQFQHYTGTQIDRIDTSLVYRSMLEGSDSTYFIQNLLIYLWWSPSFLNKSDGLYVINHGFPTVPGGTGPPLEEQFAKYPTQEGDTLRYHYLLIRTIAVGTQVPSEAGVLRCIGYDAWQNDTIHMGTFWVAPDIGIVKSWQLVGIDTMYTSLVSYKLR